MISTIPTSTDPSGGWGKREIKEQVVQNSGDLARF
jgi:hypothetical protein